MPKDGLWALVADLDYAIENLTRAGNAAAFATARAVEAEAVRRSSGTRTAADRRRADYPYAKKHGLPLWDPSTINVGAGDFRRHWLIEPNPKAGGLMDYVVRNDARVAEWLEEGTPKMFSRPLYDHLLETSTKTWDRVAPPLIAAALRPVFGS